MTEPFFPADVVAFVARSARISLDDIRGTSKAAIYVRARAVAAKVLRERGLSYKQIGRTLRKDHTTILHAIQTFDARHAKDPVFREMLDYAMYEFTDEPPKQIVNKYNLRAMAVGAAKTFATPAPEDERRLRKAASNMNERTGMYFSVNKSGSDVRITRVR